MTAAPAMIRRLDPMASQAVFRCLLNALSRPGSVHKLPTADAPVPGPAASLGALIVPLGLADVDTTVAVVDDEAAAEEVCRATGAAAAPADSADLVALRQPVEAATISRLTRGSALAPEGGAKVGIDCTCLHAGRAGGVTLTLSGPGVPHSKLLGVDGLTAETLGAVAHAQADRPAGIDVWLIDERGQVAGLPRSCRIGVS